MTFILLFGVDASAQTFYGWSSNGYLNSMTVTGSDNLKGSYDDYSLPSDDALNLGTTNAGDGAYKITKNGGSVQFTTTSKLSSVTIGFFLTDDNQNTKYKLTNNYSVKVNNRSCSINIDFDKLVWDSGFFGIGSGYYVKNKETYVLVTIELNAGTNTISYDNIDLGLFYIREELIINEEVQVSGEFSLDDYVKNNMIGSNGKENEVTLGLWKPFRHTNGMTLYLGGWKYQDTSALLDMYTRSSEDYIVGGTNQADEWEHPETQYQFGNEDPYHFDEKATIGTSDDGSVKIQRTVTQPVISNNHTRYAYNTIDNGRNEYVESNYGGKYSYRIPETKGDRTQGDPFTVPCMGDFIKLEPDYDGHVTLYLMQNGTIDFDVSKYRQNGSGQRFGITQNRTTTYYGKWHGGLLSNVCWRPVYIVDEAGTCYGEDDVTASTNTWITIGRGDTKAYVYDSNNKRAVLCEKDKNGGYVSDNSAWYVTDEDGELVLDGKGNYLPAKRITYADCVEALNKDTDIYGNKKSDPVKESDKAHYDFFNNENVWPSSVTTTGSSGTGVKAKVWGPKDTGDGWIIISKGYVKYEFDVKAGKSYYVFSNSTKIGFCGFNFVVENYTAPTGDITLYDNKKIDEQRDDDGNTLVDKKAYAKVTLNRTFKPGWNAICLPFSVHESQMRKWFGTNNKENYELVTYNGVGRDKKDGKLKAFFFHHVYQDIIAGYPYMLWIPEGANALPTNENPDPQVAFTNVTLELNTSLWNDFTNSIDYMPEDVSYYKIAPERYFTFTSFYSPTAVAKGDYYVIPDGLQLYNYDNADGKQKMRGFSAMMKLNENQNGVKEMVRLSGTNFTNIVDDMESAWDEATVINEIAEEMGLLPKPSNIYNLNGQLVRQNSTSLVGLPKGIYIVNGKKQLVK